MTKQKTNSTWRELAGLRPLQLAVATGLLLLVATIFFQQKFCVLDADIWWHLKVGDWILAHHTVPHTGILTYTAAERPWIAYSWVYEVALSRAYAWLGFSGIGWFGLLLTLGVTVIALWSTLRLSRRFWLSCALTAAGCYGFLYSLLPRPVFISIILFTVVLTLVLEARRRGRVEPLYVLPPLFVLWANIHIQFIYGLFLLALLIFVELAQEMMEKTGLAPVWLLPRRLPLGRTCTVAAACVLATCIGPYGVHLYRVILDYSQAKFAYQVIRELQAVDFRSPQHFVELLLVSAAMATIGWQRRLDLYKLVLLVIAAAVAFRTGRDSWFVCIPAVACLTEIAGCSSADAEKNGSGSGVDRSNSVFRPRDWAAVATATLFFALLLARNTGFDESGLEQTIRGYFPLEASQFLRAHPQSGPLYNPLDWGGFLSFALPEYPVAIDGRNDLFGDELDHGFYQTQMGQRAPDADPYLRNAQVVILQRSSPLAGILHSDSRLRLVYRDDIAVIYLRR